MLTYIQVHLYLVFPPIVFLLALYYPLLGRRDYLKILWLCFMSTIYTTGWDNWIIWKSGWSYPEGSILGRIWLVPIEEHIFFLVQPIFLILLYTITSHHRLLPFDLDKPKITREIVQAEITTEGETKHLRYKSREYLQTLPARPKASLLWIATFLLGAVLVNEAHGFAPDLTPLGMRIGMKAFYMGWILVWISPVLWWLTLIGANVEPEGWRSWFIGSAWMCMVDTIAIRNGAWSISTDTSLGLEVVRGLPLEEFAFFLLTSYLVVIATSLITQLHTILVLSPECPPCPPKSLYKHIKLLAKVALNPPPIDHRMLLAIADAEETLRKGSKSFSVAKLAFGRELRLGLVAVYAWCRVTDDLIDSPDSTHSKLDTLTIIRKHLGKAFSPGTMLDPYEIDFILDDIPHLTSSDRQAFWLFASLIPRLSPIEPFLELCQGYETDLRFASGSTSLVSRMTDPDFKIENHLPIVTTDHLMQYADDVAGSIASAICYLAWSLLTCPEQIEHANRPVEALAWTSASQTAAQPHEVSREIAIRSHTVSKAREMGRALQLVNISRDVAKDALIGRIYVPLSVFPSHKELLGILIPSTETTYAPLTSRLLDMAEAMRDTSIGATRDLPSTARAGARSMAASYFQIGNAIRRNGGEVYDTGIKVNKWRRAYAAAKVYWFGL